MFTRSCFALILGLALTAPLAAQGPGPGFGKGPGHGARMCQKLGLSEAQQAEVKALAEKHRQAMQPKLDAAAQARKAFRDAMRDPATPEGKLKELHDAAAQAQFQVALERRAHHQQFLARLTPDQKAKAEQFRAEREKRRTEGFRGPGPHRGRGPAKTK